MIVSTKHETESPLTPWNPQNHRVFPDVPLDELTYESDAVITEKIEVYDACLLRDGLKCFARLVAQNLYLAYNAEESVEQIASYQLKMHKC